MTAPSPKLAESDSWAMLPTLATMSMASAGQATPPPGRPSSGASGAVGGLRRAGRGDGGLRSVLRAGLERLDVADPRRKSGSTSGQ